ncbi:hypothetical protein GEMRC1_001017 [Eukaryota sp. GEM-RC1]
MDVSVHHYLAGNIPVQIKPRFDLSDEAFHFISGDVGPLYKDQITTVPLWMALFLAHENKHASVIVPEWLNKESLQEILFTERNERTFAPLPSEHFWELSILVLSVEGNGPTVVTLKRTLDQILAVRQKKARIGMQMVTGKEDAFLFAELTSFELLTLRTTLTTALKLFTTLGSGDTLGEAVAADSSSRSLGSIGTSSASSSGMVMDVDDLQIDGTFPSIGGDSDLFNYFN